jgi:hypothetical protein
MTLRLLLLALALSLLASCRGQANVVDHCIQNPGACPPCASSAECTFTGNPCTETVFCTHRSAGVAVIEIGCDEALEYSWPDAEECACAASTCRHTE